MKNKEKEENGTKNVMQENKKKRLEKKEKKGGMRGAVRRGNIMLWQEENSGGENWNGGK